MIEKRYFVEDVNDYSVVYECKAQKDILSILDDMIDTAENWGWNSVFADDCFYIEYTDGTTYTADFTGEEGRYRKKGY